MLENRIIEELLKLINQAVSNLRIKQKIDLEEYLKNWEVQDIVEREFQKAIQACIDIGARIIAMRNLARADDYHQVFEVLLNERILSKKMAQEMKKMVGFRNALVHEYRHIRPEEVYRHLKESLGIFEEFAREIVGTKKEVMNKKTLDAKRLKRRA
ncbi:MAG: DUF86 domain-containing protein [Candidatus Edwardsbacteria bacterium]